VIYIKKFTVCVATYNQMNYLEVTLKSIFKQKYKNIEVIIADDCSRDFDEKKIINIIEKYNKNKFEYKIIHNKNNLGTVKNLNNALDYATGDYILFFAGDDALYDENVIDNFVKSFKANPNVNIITSQCFLYDSELKNINQILIDKFEAYKINSVNSRKQYYYMCKDCFYASGATAYKREKIIEYNKFSTKYKYVEDWSLWLRMLRNGEKIIYQDFVTLCHRDGGISHSTDKLAPHVLEYYKDLKKIYINEIFKYFYKLKINELIQLLIVMIKKGCEIKFKKNYNIEDKLHSFVICAYKEQPHLEDCIKSLKNQTLKSRIIISTSTPNDFIESISKKYKVDLRINKKTKGHIKDFCFAYEQADTKYVTLCHQDDIYYENFAEEVVKKMEKSQNPLIAFTNYNEIRNNKKIKFNKLLFIKRLINFPLLIFKKNKKIRLFTLSIGNAICAPTVTYNKELIEKPVTESKLKANMDWDTWIHLAKKEGSFVYIKKQLLGRRIHEESLTTNVIQNNVMREENKEIFSRFWNPTITNFLTKLYSISEKSNGIKK